MIFNMIGKSGGISFVKGADAILTHSVSGGMVDHGVITFGDGNKYRLFEITQSGTLTFDSAQIAQGLLVDIWMCGGGCSGGGGFAIIEDSSSYTSGMGGAGAKCICLYSKKIPKSSALITIGAGGVSVATGYPTAGGETKIVFDTNDSVNTLQTITPNQFFFNGDAKGTLCGNGGGGSAYIKDSITGGLGYVVSSGESIYRPFLESSLPLCCSGGGGAGIYRSASYACWAGGNGGENGTNGTQSTYYNSGSAQSLCIGGTGGSGAGNGGSAATNTLAAHTGGNATTYGSGGGGSARSNLSTSVDVAGGSGKQGVIYIRVAA